MGFVQVLTLIFITLKLTHYIDWSWWWVFSPVLITLGISGVLFTVYFFLTTPEERVRNSYRRKLGL